jgi:hypothetical protein
VIELICHSHSHNCIRTSGAQVWRGTAAAVAATGILDFGWTWSLGYGLDFLLGFWLFLLGALPLEKGVLPWLVIGLLSKLFCLSRLRCSEVAFVPMVGWQYCYIFYGKMSMSLYF